MSDNSNGLVKIAGPNGSSVPYALLSSSRSGSSTSAFGYTTTSLTLGPSIDNNTVLGSTGGGWIIYGTGPTGSNYTNLYAQLVDLSGSSSIGVPYSLLGYTGPTGSGYPTLSPLNGTYGDVSGAVITVTDGYISSISNSATKSFIIDHPLYSNKYLVHACLEGPESGVYYRGKDEITNNISITIQLPDYVEKLATDLTVQITPIYNELHNNNNLRVSEVINNMFTVFGNNGKFFWIVYGKRENIMNIEPIKDEVDVKGNGPYKWI